VLCNGKGGSNDDNYAEMTSMTAKAAASVGSWEQCEFRRGSAAPPWVDDTR
jgi:hypothetical protein